MVRSYRQHCQTELHCLSWNFLFAPQSYSTADKHTRLLHTNHHAFQGVYIPLCHQEGSRTHQPAIV